MHMPDAGETPELSRVRSSDFFRCKAVLGAAAVGGGEAGMEKPTTVDVGRLDEPGLRRREAHDFWRDFGAGAGAGVDVEASAVDVDGMGASTDVGCETSGSVLGSAEIEVDGSVNGSFGSVAEVEGSDAGTEGFSSACSCAFTTEKEVFVESGELGTGVSGAVDNAGVVVDSVPLM